MKEKIGQDEAGGGRTTPHAAFTLVEVLLALLIAAILVTVAASALIQSLRAEERASILREGTLRLRAAVTHQRLDTTGALDDPAWSTLISPAREGLRPGETWAVVELVSRDDASIGLRLAMRKPQEDD